MPNNSTEEFAKIEGESYSISIDTAAFKKRISESLFPSDEKFDYDKIEIKKQLGIGEKESVYYVQLTNFNKNLKTARWLEKAGDILYLDNAENDDDVFNQLYCTCQGLDNCLPNVYVKDKKRFWICGDYAACSIKDSASVCQSSKALVSPSH